MAPRPAGHGQLDAASAGSSRTVLDVLDLALAAGGRARAVDVLADRGTADVAAIETPTGCRAALVNHEADALEVVLRPLGPAAGRPGRWTDLASARPLKTPGTGSDLKLIIPARSFICVEFVMTSRRSGSGEDRDGLIDGLLVAASAFCRSV
jgi:hypothetical protein